MSKPKKIGKRLICDTIPYRSGLIEIYSNIHEDSVNLEAWHIQPELDPKRCDAGDYDMMDDIYSGNVELELTRETTVELIILLQKALKHLDKAKKR